MRKLLGILVLVVGLWAVGAAEVQAQAQCVPGQSCAGATGEKCCSDSNGYLTCLDTETWSSRQACPSGQLCSFGGCVAPPNTPIPTPTTASCTNTCSPVGAKQCVDATSRVRECQVVGECRQWVNVYSCPFGCNETNTDCANPDYCYNHECDPDPSNCGSGYVFLSIEKPTTLITKNHPPEQIEY